MSRIKENLKLKLDRIRKKIKLQDCNDDFEDVQKFVNNMHGKGTDCNDDFEDFQNWLNTNHTPQEYEIDMEDVEKFVNNMHGKGTEIYQHEGFTCTQCNGKFKELKNLNKHIKNVHQEKKLKCQNCNYATNDTPSMRNHVKRCDVRTKKELEKAKKLKLNMNEVPTQTLDNMNEVPAQDESITTEKSAFNNLLNEKTWFVRGFQDLLGALQEYKSR